MFGLFFNPKARRVSFLFRPLRSRKRIVLLSMPFWPTRTAETLRSDRIDCATQHQGLYRIHIWHFREKRAADLMQGARVGWMLHPTGGALLLAIPEYTFNGNPVNSHNSRF